MSSFYQGWDFDPDAITGGVESVPRRLISSSACPLGASGRVNFTYFTPLASATITQIATQSGGIAAAATPTLCRVGFYSVASNGDLTLVCACANDTALWAGTFTDYVRSLSTGGGLPASYTFVPGQRYASAILVVSAGATPTFYGNVSQNSTHNFRAPRLSMFLGGQTDLPTSATSGSLTAGFNHFAVTGLP